MNVNDALVNIENLEIAFGGLKAIDNVSIKIKNGEFIGLIGPNGAGKTTFFNSITGNVVPTSGKIIFGAKNIIKEKPSVISNHGISRTFQNIRLFSKMTVLQNVSIAMHSTPGYSIFSAALGLPIVKKQQKLIETKALEFLSVLGLEEYKDRQAGTLSYGLQRKLEIARALANSPKLLLLDEPAAGMNNDECNELINILKSIYKRFNISIILIEHHIDIVLNLCSRIYVLNLGRLLAEGSPEEIQSNQDVIKAYLGERRNISG